jgi:copper transport protein
VRVRADARAGRRRARRRRPGRLAALLAGCLLSAAALAVFGPASAAWAHAVLARSDPPAGAELDAGPERITLGFTEQVSVEADAIRVLDASGGRVDSGGARAGRSASEATVGLKPGLARGTYVVGWRVVSADSHPISGAFAFGVGVAPAADAAVSASLDDSGSAAVGAAAGVARFVAFAGTALLLGGGFFLLVLWPAGAELRRARVLVWTGWGASAAAAVVLLFLQGLYTSGLGLADIAGSGPLSATLGDRYGRLILVRLVALALAVPLLRAALRRPPAPSRTAAIQGTAAIQRKAVLQGKIELAALGAVVAATFGMIGHGGTGELGGLASAAMSVHLVAISVWLGGLAVLAGCLLWPGGRAQAADLVRVLPLWSRTAMASVALIVATGVYQSLREVAAVPALVETGYGRLLLYKILIVVLMLGLAVLARRWVVRHCRPVVHALASLDATAAPAAAQGPERPAQPGEIAALRRGVIFEVVLGATALAITAVLVNTIPAKASYSPPFSDTVFAGPLTVDVQVKPTHRGLQNIHVYTYDPAGRAQPLEEARAQLSLPDAGVGPMDVPLVLPGPGHAAASGVPVQLPGVWQLRLTLRVDEFNQYVTTVFYEVR